jgi:CheY-specific phosphatase CheX
MTNLIIGDVHTKFEKVEKIIKDYDCPVIFIGDYFALKIKGKILKTIFSFFSLGFPTTS